MKKYISISSMGKDRPGIVANFSRVLYELGCNLEESSMLRLRGEFAILLLVSLPEGMQPQVLDRALQVLSKDMQLTTSVRVLSAEEIESPKIHGELLYVLSVYGADKPGIVYHVTQRLADLQINITDLNTRVLESGETPVYVLMVEIELADESQLEFLPDELEKLKKQLKVEITMNPAEPTEF